MSPISAIEIAPLGVTKSEPLQATGVPAYMHEVY